MGIFDKLFGSSQSEEVIDIPWNELSTLNQLDAIIEESKTILIVIFKHSTRCGTSRMVLRQFEKNFALEDEQVKLYFLNLLNYREVSNEIVIRFQVFHQSPQLLIIKNAQTVAHASHYQINEIDLEQYI